MDRENIAMKVNRLGGLSQGFGSVKGMWFMHWYPLLVLHQNLLLIVALPLTQA
jgi:hypothetical protein